MPIKVIDKKTQQEIEVPSSEAERGIQQGDYLITEPTVRITRDGKVGTVAASDLVKSIGAGSKLVDDDEADAIRLRREESDIGSQIQGGIEAAAAGATLGLSTLAEEKFLGGDPERMRARREGLGGLGTGLEVAGALAPALLTGGSSATVSGGRVAAQGARAGLLARSATATPAGLLARAGAGIERGAVGLLPEATPGLVRTLVPSAARGGFEGAWASAGQQIDEDVLGGREITAENLLEAMGHGAVLGGAAGTIVPGMASAGAGMGRQAIKPIKQVLGRAAGYVDDVADGGLAKLVADPRAQAFAAKAWGVPEDEVRLIFATEPDRLVQLVNRESTAMLEELGASARPIIEGFRASRRMSVEEGSGLARRAAVERNLPHSADDLARVQSSAQERLNEIDGLADSTLRAIERGEISVSPTAIRSVKSQVRQARLAVLREADPTDFEAIATAQLRNEGKFAGTTTAATRQIDQRVVSATAVTELDRLKQHIDRIAAQQRKIAHAAETGSPTADVLSDMSGRLRTHLEDAVVHGKAGTMQAERNALMNRAITARRNLSGASKNLIDASRPLDNADLLTVMRNGGTWRGSTKTENLVDYLDAESDLMRWHLQHSEIDDLTRKAFDEQLAANKSVRGLIDERADMVRKLDVLERWRNMEGNRSVSTSLFSTPGTAVAGLLGGAIGGLPGAALGLLASAATKPYSMTRKMAAILARTNGSEKRAMSALSGVMRRLGSGVEAAGSVARGGVTGIERAAPHFTGDRRARLEAIRAAAVRMAANPGLLAEQQRRLTIDLDEDAPRLAQAIAAKTAVAVQYLADNAPAGYDPDPLQRGKVPPMIDPIELDAWERRVEAVFDPNETLARIGTGTLTEEHLDALSKVWPAKFDAAQKAIFEAVAKTEGPIDLDVATQLSALWNAPVDPTLELAPGISMAFAGGQAMAAQQAQQQMPGAKPSKPAKPPKLELNPGAYDTSMDAATKASQA